MNSSTTGNKVPKVKSKYSLLVVDSSTTGRQDFRGKVKICITGSGLSTTGRSTKNKTFQHRRLMIFLSKTKLFKLGFNIQNNVLIG